MSSHVFVVIGGDGYWGRNLVRNLSKIGDVLTIDTKGKADYATLDGLASPNGVDGVVIATPPASHCDLALEALEKCPGAKVLIEKPMTLTLAECRALEPYQERIMVDHTFLFVPEFEYIRSLLSGNGLGAPLYAYSDRLNLGKFQECGVVWDLAPHDLALFQWLFGCVPAVQQSMATPVRYDKPDMARVDLLYGGVNAHLHISWLHPTKVRRTTIVCDQGMIVYDMLAEEKVKIYYPGAKMASRSPTESYGEYLMGYRSGDVVSPVVRQHEPLMAMCKEFLDFCRGGETRSGFDLGRDVVTVLHEIEEQE